MLTVILAMVVKTVACLYIRKYIYRYVQFLQCINAIFSCKHIKCQIKSKIILVQG
jgi:hypothetical protein